MKVKNAKCCALCVWFAGSNVGSENSTKGTCTNEKTESSKVWSHNYCDGFELYYEYENEFGINEVD